MWAVIVVVHDPTGDCRSGVVEVAEQGLVEEFVPHAAVEGESLGAWRRFDADDLACRSNSDDRGPTASPIETTDVGTPWESSKRCRLRRSWTLRSISITTSGSVTMYA